MSYKEIYGISKVECSFTSEENEKIEKAIKIFQIECNVSFETAKNIIESVAKEFKNTTEDIKKLGEYLRGLETTRSHSDLKILSKNSVNPYERSYQNKKKW